MQQRAFRPFSLPLRPVGAAVSLLFASAAAWGAGAGAASTQVASVEFDNLFLQQPNDGARIDTSRFTRGNAALPGDYRVDLYVNDSWLGRAEVQLRQAQEGGDVQVCFDRALLERVGVDLMKLSPEAAARLEQGGGACVALPSLIADATATFDNGEQRLDISVPQIALARTARGYVAPRYWDEGVTAARLQYNANAYHADAGRHELDPELRGTERGHQRRRHGASVITAT